MIELNLNDNVEVRLNDHGLAILKAQHDDLARRFPSLGSWVPPAADADGWSRFQLWVLMRDLGPSIMMGGEPPFETTIRIAPRDHGHWKWGPLEYTRAGSVSIFRLGPVQLLRAGRRYRLALRGR
jgi:hypothetical protein